MTKMTSYSSQGHLTRIMTKMTSYSSQGQTCCFILLTSETFYTNLKSPAVSDKLLQFRSPDAAALEASSANSRFEGAGNSFFAGACGPFDAEDCIKSVAALAATAE